MAGGGVTGVYAAASVLAQLDGADDSSGKEEERGDQLEGAAHDDAYQSEGQQQKPDEWVEQHRDDGDRPAGDEQYTEEEQFKHGVSLLR